MIHKSDFLSSLLLFSIWSTGLRQTLLTDSCHVSSKPEVIEEALETSN